MYHQTGTRVLRLPGAMESKMGLRLGPLPAPDRGAGPGGGGEAEGGAGARGGGHDTGLS